MRSKKNTNSEKRHVSGSPTAVTRHLAWYLGIPLVLLFCIFAPWQRTVNNFFAPYLSLNNAAGSLLADQTLKLRSRSALAEEVEKLRKQNLELIMQNDQNKRFARENRQLRAMLDLPVAPGYDHVACDVVLRDPWMWESGFTINRGSRDGMQEGLAVIAPVPDKSGKAVLLGVIESVNKYSAHVISVLNPEVRISVWLPESGAVGFLNAGTVEKTSSGTAAVGFLPANRTFVLNELIYTTGFEAAIPAGLGLGSLESIAPASLPFGNRLYRHGAMRPAGDLERLRSVIVARIKKTPGTGQTGKADKKAQ